MTLDTEMFLVALPALWLLLALLLRALHPLAARHLPPLEPHARALLLRQLALAPPLIAAAIAALLYLPGSPLLPTHCHDAYCAPHAPHAIAGWWLLIPLALLTLPAVARSLRALREGWHLQRQWRRLSEAGNGYRIIDSEQPLACTIGLWRTDIYLSRGLLEQLPADDIDIIVAHEHTHRLRHDNLWRWLARIATLGLVPTLCRDLELAQEEICDRAAAADRDELAVAETLLRCARLMQQPHRLVCAFFRDALDQRVRALLQPVDRQLPATATLWLPAALIAISFTAVLPLHLLLEHLHWL